MQLIMNEIFSLICGDWVTRAIELPAMDHDGSGARWVGHLDPADEGQEARGMVGYAVVRPACEVELLHFPELVKPSLASERPQQRSIKQRL